MTETSSRSDTATCGNCGAAVGATDVTCPSCGVLLAAYQAAVGSLGGAVADTEYTPPGSDPILSVPFTPATPVVDPTVPTGTIPPPSSALPPPVVHTPASLSPIDDAMRRARGEDVEAATRETSAATAEELAQMATSDSALAQEVEAELAGAKVTFEGASPAIVTEPAATAPTLVRRARPAEATNVVDEAPVPPPITPAPRRVPVPPTVPGQAPQVGPQSGRPIQWIPLIVVGVLILVVLRATSSIGGLITLLVGVLVVVWLLRLAGGAGRKTTWMPWDDSNNKTRRK